MKQIYIFQAAILTAIGDFFDYKQGWQYVNYEVTGSI